MSRSSESSAGLLCSPHQTQWVHAEWIGTTRAHPQARVGSRWLEQYHKMLHVSAAGQLIPRDHLSLWLALRELGADVRVAERPVKWNFLTGPLLELPIGTEEVPESSLDPAVVLHFAQNKADPWARRNVDDVLARSGAADVLSARRSTRTPG